MFPGSGEGRGRDEIDASQLDYSMSFWIINHYWCDSNYSPLIATHCSTAGGGGIVSFRLFLLYFLFLLLSLVYLEF